MHDEVMAFALRLFDQGIEITLRGTRVHLWPGRSYPRLPYADRVFFHAHLPELRDMVRAGRQPRLPEVSDVSQSTDSQVSDVSPSRGLTSESEPSQPAAHGCVYCGGRPCVGQAHPAYRTLHWNAPDERERRWRLAESVKRRP